ncbi:DEAD/DEAH box helicase family protein [Helicobacter suis]|uniref:DEAD/DEAH box helicase family protein n=1 Tax=Helicobacter suis TaxID=104628 RepID=UPI000CF18EA9|nr:DEAD/DEAH box helicase family protein [Helicobacter suis]
MAIQITKLQDQKVDALVAYYEKVVYLPPPPPEKVDRTEFIKTDRVVEFKAPTGSGKTLMASQFISKLIANFIEIQFIFIIATLSSAELPEAFERKIKDYRDQGILETTNFEVEYYTSPSSSKNNKQCEYVPPIRCEKNKVYLSYPPPIPPQAPI